ELSAAFFGVASAQKALGGAGLRFLIETITSLTVAAQIRELLVAYLKAKWHQWESAGRDAVRAGVKLAFGKYFYTRYDFTTADVVLSLDGDFLVDGLVAIRYVKDWSSRRKAREEEKDLSWLYVVETARTLAGGIVDHRLAARPSGVAAVA